MNEKVLAISKDTYRRIFHEFLNGPLQEDLGSLIPVGSPGNCVVARTLLWMKRLEDISQLVPTVTHWRAKRKQYVKRLDAELNYLMDCHERNMYFLQQHGPSDYDTVMDSRELIGCLMAELKPLNSSKHKMLAKKLNGLAKGEVKAKDKKAKTGPKKEIPKENITVEVGIFKHNGELRIGFYDKTRNVFVVTTDKKEIITCFSPEQGMDYLCSDDVTDWVKIK